MSQTPTARVAPHPQRPRSSVGIFRDAFRAELLKIVSLQGMRYLLVGTIALTMLLSYLFVRESQITVGSTASDNAVDVLDFGVVALGWSQVGFFLFGVIAATSEYIGGQVRTSLVAVPNRSLQRFAANCALACVTFIAGVVTVLFSIGTTLAASGVSVSDLDGLLVLRIVVSAAAYLACMALLSAGLGLLIRRAVPAAAILLVYLLIVSPLLQGKSLYFLPDVASYALWYTTVPPDAPPTAICWLVVLGWAIVPALVAGVVFSRRDT